MQVLLCMLPTNRPADKHKQPNRPLYDSLIKSTVESASEQTVPTICLPVLFVAGVASGPLSPPPPNPWISARIYSSTPLLYGGGTIKSAHFVEVYDLLD